MSVKQKNLFAWASQSEHGTINGKKGDQTGGEVKVGNYYQFGQTDAIRFPDIQSGQKAGVVAKYLCKCNLIGYGQSDRGSLFSQCSDLKWDFERIKDAIESGSFKKCNTDCSALIATVINITFGKKIVRCFSTATMKSEIIRCSEKFKLLSKKQAEKKFRKGDIVYRIGHCIINV